MAENRDARMPGLRMPRRGRLDDPFAAGENFRELLDDIWLVVDDENSDFGGVRRFLNNFLFGFFEDIAGLVLPDGNRFIR